MATKKTTDEMPAVKPAKGMDSKAADKKKSAKSKKPEKRTASKGKNTKPTAKKKKPIIVLPDLEPAAGPIDPAMLGVGGGMGAPGGMPPMRRGMGAPGLPGEMPVNPMGMQRTPPGPMGMPLAPEQLPQEPMPRPPLVPRRRY